MIVIVDYGLGNLGSIINMFKKVGIKTVTSSDPAVIESADKLILPGVGAFDAGMKNLTERGFIPLLNEMVLERKIPVIGLCLGMQLMANGSEEGQLPGLGWFDADVFRFRFAAGMTQFKIPHMSWNSLEVVCSHPLLENLGLQPRFYFVHSYHMVCHETADVLAKTEYGYLFDSVVAHGNIMGAQFHPEKSHRYGMQLLKNFAEYTP